MNNKLIKKIADVLPEIIQIFANNNAEFQGIKTFKKKGVKSVCLYFNNLDSTKNYQYSVRLFDNDVPNKNGITIIDSKTLNTNIKKMRLAF